MASPQQPLDPQLLASLAGGQQGGMPPGFPGGGQAPPGQGFPPPQQGGGQQAAPPAGGMGMAGDPSYPPGPGQQSQQGPQQGSPTDQVIWQAFPSTDPNVIGQMMQGLDGSQPGMIGQVMPAIEQMQQQDRMQFEQRQQATLNALLNQLTQPNPQMAQMPQAGPGVGGDNPAAY